MLRGSSGDLLHTELRIRQAVLSGRLVFCKFILAGQIFVGCDLAFTVLLIHRELFSSASIVLSLEQGELTL